MSEIDDITIRELAELVEMFMVGLLNDLTGTLRTDTDAPAVIALTNLQALIGDDDE